MLVATEEFFSTDDIAAIKAWLGHPSAVLFRKAIQGEVSKLQIEASTKMLQAMEPGKARFEDDVNKGLRRVAELQKVLAEMDRGASVEFQPYNVKILTK